MTWDVEKLIAPHSLEALRLSLGTRALHARGELRSFDDLVDLPRINRVLEAAQLPNDNIRLIHDNAYLPCKSADDVVSALRGGATLIVNKIHQFIPSVRSVVDEVAKYWHSSAVANMYLSQAGVGGFGSHYDTHDVIVLQVAGQKEWDIFEPTVKHPLFEMKDHDRVGPGGEPYLKATLQPGDVLYVPRGHWHRAQAREQLSMASAMGAWGQIGIAAQTGINLIHWLADEMSESEEWRRSLVGRDQGHVAKLLQDLLRKLQDSKLADRFFGHLELTAPVSPVFALPYQLSAEYVTNFKPNVEFCARSFHSELAISPEGLTLTFLGKVVTFGPEAEALVRHVVAGGVLRFDRDFECRFGLSREDYEEVSRHLIVEGFLINVDELSRT